MEQNTKKSLETIDKLAVQMRPKSGVITFNRPTSQHAIQFEEFLMKTFSESSYEISSISDSCLVQIAHYLLSKLEPLQDLNDSNVLDLVNALEIVNWEFQNRKSDEIFADSVIEIGFCDSFKRLLEKHFFAALQNEDLEMITAFMSLIRIFLSCSYYSKIDIKMANNYFNDLITARNDTIQKIIEDYVDAEAPIPRIINDDNDIMVKLSESDFIIRFRLSKALVLSLYARLEDKLLYISNRHGQISPINKLLICLSFFANGSFQVIVGDLFGKAKSTICLIVRDVSKEIALLHGEEIKMAENHIEISNAKQQFYRIGGFPNVIGAIDGTHVPIQSPGGETAELYRNRKGYFSLNLQAVVDANLIFRDIVVRWPGSTHDSTIFATCRLRARFENNEFTGCLFLGDSGYPLKHYLMTPILNPMTLPQRRYNNSQIRTRNTVERAFGVLKRRFPCLRMCLRIKVNRACAVVTACAVLHNLCINAGLPDFLENQEIEARQENHFPAVNIEYMNRIPNARANATRTAFINNYFS